MSRMKQCKCCGFMADSNLIEEGLCPFCVTKRGFKDIVLLWVIIVVNIFAWAGVFYLAARLGELLGSLI